MRCAAIALLFVLLVLPVHAGAAQGDKNGKRGKPVSRKHRAAATPGDPANTFPLLGAAAAVLLLGAGGIAVRARKGAQRQARERRDAEASAERRWRAARASARRMEALLSGSADVIAVIDDQARVTANAEAVERALELGEGGLAGRPITAFLPESEAESTRAGLAALAAEAGATATFEWTLELDKGASRHGEAIITNRLGDPEVNGFIVNLRNITKRKLLELDLRHRAMHDELTGLAHHALLEDRLRHAIARSARTPTVHALVFVALDDFQGVVDAHGRAVGDQLLVGVGKRLQARLRPNDTLARLHNDCFGVLLEGISIPDEATLAARRLLNAVAEPFHIDGHDLLVGASAGVELGDGSAPGSHEEIAARELANADVAMRAARRIGSGCVERYESRMHEAVSRRVEMRAQMRAGLRGGEFEVHYQPIVELGSERIAGYEALVRWEHPQHGLVSPAEFIPLAEQTGLIIDLGNYVLRRACAQMVEWNARSAVPAYISVNVAGQQLHNEAFADKVAAVLRGTGLPPEQLLLEVTETSLVHDADGAIRRLSALRELGVRLALDDFGTGYSSLAYLRRIPVDVLKVDKSFVDEVGAGGDDALAAAIVTLGRALGLTVIAEGIEQREQAERMQELGCTFGQGYLFSRPLPAIKARIFAERSPARLPAAA